MEIKKIVSLFIIMVFIVFVSSVIGYYVHKCECEPCSCPVCADCPEYEECLVCEICEECQEEVTLSQQQIATCSREAKSPQNCDLIRLTQEGYKTYATLNCKDNEYGHTYSDGSCSCKIRQCPLKNWEE